jgi:large subunit ribosomal protein L10
MRSHFCADGGENVPNKQNIAAVQVLKDKLGRSQLTLIGEYRGLTVTEMAALRNAIRQTNAEVVVAKNTLTKIAAHEVGITDLDEFLGGPIALTIAYEDPVATAKALNDYLKSAKKALAVRGGMMGSSRITGGDLERIANTPSREQSIARVLGGVNAPASRIVGTLQGVTRNMAYILAQIGEGKARSGGTAAEA